MARKIVTWILVADATQARLYGNDGPGKGIYRATEQDFGIELPEKARDIVTDREGRAINPGSGSPQTMSPRTNPRQHLEEEFLRKVAIQLDGAAEAKLFDRLVLVAPPKALGTLRAALGPHAAALVNKEVDKDFVPLPERDLERRLVEAEALV